MGLHVRRSTEIVADGGPPLAKAQPISASESATVSSCEWGAQWNGDAETWASVR